MKALTLVSLASLAASTLSFAQQAAPAPGAAQPEAAKPPKPDFPPFEEVTKGYEKVVSSTSGQSFYDLFVNKKTQHVLAALPAEFANQRHFFAMTLAGGESFAGLQAGEKYAYWRQYDKRLALIEPQMEIRSSGDDESKASVKRLFTDNVVIDVPILTMMPKGGPVIDLDDLFVANAPKFFPPPNMSGPFGPSVVGIKPELFRTVKAKSFPENFEVSFEAPVRSVPSRREMMNGASIKDTLKTLHYSVRLVPTNKDYKPRVADERVGFFITNFRDYGRFEPGKTATRYINRWHLEKADPSLKLSPPKKPVLFYIEHSTPIRYRRWVADGILAWNKAFEKVGLVNAVEVQFQDAKSGANMDKDPEDARYNFVRWLNNDQGTAIGPSRVNPETGEILDADVILTDGWIRHWWGQYHEVLPQIATQSFSPETLIWLERNPRWDPRLLLASPARREQILRERAGSLDSLGGHPLGQADASMMGDQEYDGLMGRMSQINGYCMAANSKTAGLADMYMLMQIREGAAEGEKKEGEKKDEAKKETSKEQLLDGIPESFIGPLLSDLVSHEVGHTLGLRHNFKGSSIYEYEKINSNELKGKKPFASSVMDYIPVNMRIEGGEVQGDYGMIGVGPYDEWAIEYGYTFEQDLKPILARAGEPELQYGTDEDAMGRDPQTQRYDFGKNPLAYAQDQMRLVKEQRSKIVDKFVKPGDSWAKARRGYMLTLSKQMRSVFMMAQWVGGAEISRQKKGDSGKRPIEVVPADQQRAAFQFVVENSFDSNAFGLSPELLNHMSLDKWWDEPSTVDEESDWPVHDGILRIQSSTLTALMEPTVLGRIYDNEFRVPADQDAFTLPEMLGKLSKAIWKQLDNVDRAGQYNARRPLIQSLDRNLQREYVVRLCDLAGPDTGFRAAQKPISDLAQLELRNLNDRVKETLKLESIDPYTKAHLLETERLIDKTLNAQIILDVKSQSSGGDLIRALLESRSSSR